MHFHEFFDNVMQILNQTAQDLLKIAKVDLALIVLTHCAHYLQSE